MSLWREWKVTAASAAFMVAATLLPGTVQTAQAVLAAVSTDAATGAVLTHPGNGFPVWYQDAAGVALEQCNFNAGEVDPFCLPFAADEHFWWTGTALLSGAGVPDATLVLALEAAFATGDPQAGQQVAFGRIRVRANLTAPGTYTVVHPFGESTYEVAAVGAGDEIDDTADIMGGALDFTTALGTAIGPFLSCADPARRPAGYLGDGVDCTVTGSPFGTNAFAIIGPGVDVSTDQFAITGKVFAGVLPLPITVDRATYNCAPGALSCTVEVFAHSVAAATLTVAIPSLGPTATAMSTDGLGSFFLTLPVDRAALPVTVDLLHPNLQIAVTASTLGFTPVTITRSLTDVVGIGEATYNTATGILTLRASSSDALAGLREGNFGDVVGGLLRLDLNGFTVLNVPPPHVNVHSSAGGFHVGLTTMLNVPEVLRVGAATYSGSRKRFRVVGSSNAPGATIALSVGGVEIGRGTVNDLGRFVVTAAPFPRANRVTVTSSGGTTTLKRVTVVP